MTAPSPAPWILAKSGVSVDAGATRIRMEASADREEIKANARLIAAAPDMLRVLTAAELALRSYEFGNASPDLARQVADAAKAVLDKAEGR